MTAVDLPATSSTATDPDVVWRPTPELVESSALARYMRGLAERGRHHPDYASLWRWSVEDLDGFWLSIWDHFQVRASARPSRGLAEERMPGARWFPGARLNYAENALVGPGREGTAIVACAEGREAREISWAELRGQVGALAATLRDLGVRPGDRVAAYAPNIPEAAVGLLASAAVGAVWASCSPDLGAGAARARLAPLRPKVLLLADGSLYGGRAHDRRETGRELLAALPEVERAIAIDHVAGWGPSRDPRLISWAEAAAAPARPSFEQVPFDHPLWVLFSSGTTGAPKGIVHGHGGIVLEHLKSLALHSDVGPRDRYLFACSTSWMVWNILVSGLLRGATIVLYDGSPTHPDPGALWRLAGEQRVTTLGVGAAYLHLCAAAGVRPGELTDLAPLRNIRATGSPLSPHAYEWVYASFDPRLWLISASGGTDVCSALLGGCPLLPVRSGRLQAPCLGVKAEVWDERGRPLVGEVGELVVTRPMPSMPLRLWGDEGGERERESYFSTYPGVWRHGDWATIFADGTSVVHGRSDATLNRGGVRIGPADLYAAVERLDGVEEALVVGAERPDGGYYMPLFVVAADTVGEDELRERIVAAIRRDLTPRHVPDEIVFAPGIPHTRTGKKLEVPVKRLFQGTPPGEAFDENVIDDPGLIEFYAAVAARQKGDRD